VQRGLAQHVWQVPPLSVPHRLVIDQRQPVAQPLEPLQEPHQLGVVEHLEATVLDQLHQMIKAYIQGVERVVDGADFPEVHVLTILEQEFDNKRSA
jgi:hypothetical protein